MEGTSQYIKVIIAGRPYMMSVERDEEEIVRKAAGLINEMVVQYSKSFEYKDQQDLFAMITLQHVANSIRMESNIAYKDNEMEKNLSIIDRLLKDHLSEN